MRRQLMHAIVLTTALGLAAAPAAADCGKDHGEMGEKHEMGEMHGDMDMSAMHEKMMAKHQAMMAEHEAALERLNAAMAALDTAASDEAREDAIVAAVRELADQHRTLLTHSKEMMGGMMHGMHGGMPMQKMQGMHEMKGDRKGCAHHAEGETCPMCEKKHSH